jgi:hypothetical protein
MLALGPYAWLLVRELHHMGWLPHSADVPVRKMPTQRFCQGFDSISIDGMWMADTWLLRM